MKLRTRVLLLTLLGLFAVGATVLVTLGYILLNPTPREVYSFERDSAMDCVLTWGRLEPFPQSAQEVKLTTGGGAFTRCFTASFVAPPEDIEEWLKSSPGAREATPTAPSTGVRVFQITPGGGANVAEVAVDDTSHRVSIRVEWS